MNVPTLPAYTVIPLVCALAYAPHFVKMGLLAKVPPALLKGYLADPRAGTAAIIAAGGKEKDVSVARAISRCTGAHFNQLEGLPVFIGSVLAAKQVGLDNGLVDTCATAYLAARIVYNWLYITGERGWKPKARAGVWGLGMLACLVLAVKTAMAGGK